MMRFMGDRPREIVRLTTGDWTSRWRDAINSQSFSSTILIMKHLLIQAAHLGVSAVVVAIALLPQSAAKPVYLLCNFPPKSCIDCYPQESITLALNEVIGTVDIDSTFQAKKGSRFQSQAKAFFSPGVVSFRDKLHKYQIDRVSLIIRAQTSINLSSGYVSELDPESGICKIIPPPAAVKF